MTTYHLGCCLCPITTRNSSNKRVLKGYYLLVVIHRILKVNSLGCHLRVTLKKEQVVVFLLESSSNVLYKESPVDCVTYRAISFPVISTSSINARASCHCLAWFLSSARSGFIFLLFVKEGLRGISAIVWPGFCRQPGPVSSFSRNLPLVCV